MRIITFNLNGIRSSFRKGFADWLMQQDADVIALQETKAQVNQLLDDIKHPELYHHYFVDAEKKGYSGVGLYLRKKPQNIVTQLGWEISDKEGRYLQADYDNFSIISVYLPSGSSGEERQAVKLDFLDRFMLHLRELRFSNRKFIICGDWNIAHTKKDIKNWRGNQKNSGFTPEERAWMDTLFGDAGFVDAFRVVNQEDEQYTWWSNRGKAWEKNVGWRIDYQVITPNISVKTASIYKDQRFSDHAPLIIDYDLTF